MERIAGRRRMAAERTLRPMARRGPMVFAQTPHPPPLRRISPPPGAAGSPAVNPPPPAQLLPGSAGGAHGGDRPD